MLNFNLVKFHYLRMMKEFQYLNLSFHSLYISFLIDAFLLKNLYCCFMTYHLIDCLTNFAKSPLSNSLSYNKIYMVPLPIK